MALKNKKYLSSFLCMALTVIGLEIYQRQEQEKEIAEFDEDATPSSVAPKRELAAAQPTKLPEEVSNRDNGFAISPNDPVIRVLNTYRIVPENHFEVSNDQWFFSQNIVQIQNSDEPENKGEVLSVINNTSLVSTKTGLDTTQYPPLVISYTTNKPVLITGDLLIEIDDREEAGETESFLQEFPQIDQIILNESLLSAKRILIKPIYKSKVLELYQKLKPFIGQHNIKSIGFDARHQFKTI